MPYIKHESGEAGELRNSQILGDRSPLEFDEDGYAYVEDPIVADKLLAMHRHIERGGHGPGGSDDIDEPDDESETLPFNPEEHTNDEIAERVKDVDDAAALEALRNLEEEQKDRDGAKDAIDARMDELED
ncbi:hypothetical protein [Halostagnicola kamekurae]|uniref:Uncharacterized protein n=1 Tax=Halostagnicola kamekurae TaxID=619731 RepID=A0A1I6RE52_9EURY|nr:hypothetical protein [Halostagnicola kamekurae]SFS62982.1 hypothetical protein SAMN04488556_1732 [Halostagnicola kamekurae]